MDGWIDGWILWARGLRVTNTTFTQQRISPKTRRSSTSTGTEARHWYDNERPSQSPFSCYLSLSPPMSLYQHPPPPPAATLTRFMRRPRGAQKPKGTYRHCIAGHITYRYFFHPRISSLAELTLFPSGPSTPPPRPTSSAPWTLEQQPRSHPVLVPRCGAGLRYRAQSSEGAMIS